MEWFYVVVPWQDRKRAFGNYVFGPYRTEDEALEASDDRLGPGIIVVLPTRDREEAIKMLGEVEQHEDDEEA